MSARGLRGLLAKRAPITRVTRVTLGALGAAATAAVAAGGCQQEATEVAVRSLERSGTVAFLCLAAPGEPGGPGLPLSSCTRARAESLDDFAPDETGRTTLPHLYALVTQTTRGEIALVDLTAQADSVIDQNAVVPGKNFLPVGAQPVDVVASPGGTAAFVAVAEIGREGLFALPSTMLRPAGGRPVPRLTSWPACALPAAPGDLALAVDPAKDGAVRASCDAPYGEVPAPGANGDLSRDGDGRLKIVVGLPDLGGIAVVDAQSLLDRAPGSFDACPIERWLPLSVERPPPAPPPQPEPTNGCVNPIVSAPEPEPSPPARPAGLAMAEDRLYVADLAAPVIHVVRMETPCDPVELPPLLPESADDPRRRVVTSRVAVSALATPELRRFLYAIDVLDGSTMVFDVSDDASPRTPLRRAHPEWNPFQPADRIKFIAPAQDVLVAEHDVPETIPTTGAAPSGIRCSPDPALEVCTTTSSTCAPGTLYRTGPEYDRGAGPRKLRGSFGFVLLSTGQIAVIDLDDFDAYCRVPQTFGSLAGCPPIGMELPFEATTGLASSGEASCNVVLPNQPRSAFYVLTNDAVGSHQPGIQTFPLLYDQAGALVPSDTPGAPIMRATVPTEAGALSLAVGGSVLSIDPATGLVPPAQGQSAPRHTLAMNLEDPRAHIVDQGWTVTYEGSLAGFGGKLGELRLGGESGERVLHDANSRFCSAGVQSEASLVAQGFSEEEAIALADFVQIAGEIPDEEDLHWEGAACTVQQCSSAFGTADLPRPERELRIVEAYQDHLVLAPGLADDALVKCCFPALVPFRVRARGQWVVLGEASGFLHHVTTDPETGACRPRCAPGTRLNGRVRTAPADAVVKTDDPFAFQNPMFRFAITGGTPQRDQQFRFSTQGAFATLTVNLASQTNDVQPQSLSYLPPTGQIVVTDGSLEGLLVIGLESVDVTAQYF